MISHNKWTSRKEVTSSLKNLRAKGTGAGPTLYRRLGETYTDDGEGHVMVVGRSGMGKSQCITHPLIKSIAEKGESGIFVDPKGEEYASCRKYFKYHQIYCIDLRDPWKSPSGWSPLALPLKLYRSEDPAERDLASQMIADLYMTGVYPWDHSSDAFWPTAAANLAKGLTYALFDLAEEDQITIDSVAAMMEQAEISFGGSTYAREFYELLPENSMAKRNLAGYVTAPKETRGSIHSVATTGIEVFSRSRGLMKMLSRDTIDIANLDVTKPFAVFILLADETDIYHGLCGILIAQIIRYLISLAHKNDQRCGGSAYRGVSKLPVRVSIILEELGSIGRCIDLPNLMTAGRSRNIRMYLILQSLSQLDLYGAEKAKTIQDSVGITIGFSTNSDETLELWSRRCGVRDIECAGGWKTVPLITAEKLGAMPPGKALIMINRRFKYITDLPFFYEQTEGKREPEAAWDYSAEKNLDTPAAEPFDLKTYVKEKKKQKLLEMMKEQDEEGELTHRTEDIARRERLREEVFKRRKENFEALEKEEEVLDIIENPDEDYVMPEPLIDADEEGDDRDDDIPFL